MLGFLHTADWQVCLQLYSLASKISCPREGMGPVPWRKPIEKIS